MVSRMQTPPKRPTSVMPNRQWLLPSLLDRLTDHEPGNRHEPASARGLDEARVRELVRRDLTWLFNATRLESSVAFDRFPEVRRSVLNFGIVDLTGKTLSSIESEALEREILGTLRCFEPRLDHDTLKVRVGSGQSRAGGQALIIEIVGALWAEPVPIALHLRTEVDLESGRVSVDELGREGDHGSAISRPV